MKFTQPSDDILIVKVEANAFAFLFLVCFIVLGSMAALQYARTGSMHSERFQGSVGGAAMGLLGFLFMFERSVFVFDGVQRQVRWHRRRALRKRAGVIPFGMIQSVAMQSPLGDEGVPSRRIVLVLPGQEIPISMGYFPDHGDSCLMLGERIRQLIGLSERDRDLFMASVRAAIESGRITEAVRLLREEKQMSLEEAKQRVDAMRRDAATEQENR